MFKVVAITQNVDELHERAGSTNVIHVHGQRAYAKGTSTACRRYRMGGDPLLMGQLCDDGTQLRPDVVWFGEDVEYLEEAKAHIASAARVLVVGTSLAVFPVAPLAKAARGMAEKVLVALDVKKPPYGYRFLRGKATQILSTLAAKWLAEF